MVFSILSCSVNMWKCVVSVLCTCGILVQSQDVALYRDLSIAQGMVRGHLDPDNHLYVFYNIPYATAPSGPDRFKAPRPPPVFLSTFDAIDRGIICPGTSAPGLGGASILNMREDCLVANVFVPETATALTRLPVLVVIHGGAYQYGYGEQEKFRELANTKSQPVIVVTFNYRLGVHGFLCLGTEGAPGNAGLKDQVALLRWVNTNIARFGGNPEDVTLAACGAGSGSVDFLTLSTITKGLFKKAIVESGVSTGAVGPQINSIENAKYYAKLLDFKDVDDLNKLEEFYKTATFQTLLSRSEVIMNNQDVAILFGPCVESDIGQERVVFNAPFNIIKEGNYTQIPLMYGFTNMNGAMRLPYFDSWSEQMNRKFSDFLPAELHFDSEHVKEEVAQKVKEFYFGAEAVSVANIQQYIFYFTDVLFGYPILRSLSTRLEALDDEIYLFKYSFVDKNTPCFPKTDIQGASHCHQMFAVMDEDVTDKTEEYKTMKATLRKYWHNFILTGSPDRITYPPHWPRATAKRSPYMSLGPVIELKDDEDILGDRAAFWEDIYEKYYRGPVMPVTSTPTTTQTTTEDTSVTTDSSSSEDTTTSSPTPDSTTTVMPTSPDAGSGTIVIPNVIFVVVSLSFYYSLY